MASDNFGLRIGLEGEKEFKKALADINASFKVLGSEMKLVASQFDKNDKSVEALTSRNAVLNKEIEAQKQKIETLKAALDNAASSFGENDRRTQNWQIQLNNAEAALNGMQRELEENNTALASASRASIRRAALWTISIRRWKTSQKARTKRARRSRKPETQPRSPKASFRASARY